MSCTKFKNIQRCTTVQFPKQFSHSSLCSFGVQGPSITGQDCGRDLTGEADSSMSSPFIISCTQFKIPTAQHDSPVPKQFSHSSLCFFGGPCLSITDQDCGRDFMGEADSNLSQPFGTHLLYTIQNPYSSAWQSSSETVFTLFSLFFGGLCLSITDQDWGRDFMGETDSNLSQPFVIHLLYTIQNPYSSAWRSSFRNSFHTLLFVFWWTKS